MATTTPPSSLEIAQGARLRPIGFTVTVRDTRAYTGAGRLVALSADMQRMPGYGRTPAAHAVDVDETGRTSGLF